VRALTLVEPGALDIDHLRLSEQPIPDPAADELLLRVAACGVCRTVKGSTIRITPPSDTRGSDRRARPFVRPAFGESRGPAVFGYRRARPSSVPDVVSPPRSARRTPRALARGVDDRRSGRGRGTLGARSSKEPLGECIRPRCADRRSNDPENLASRSRRRNRTPDSRSSMARFLACSGDPRRVGVRGDARQVHSPGRELNEEQDVERLQSNRLDGEEVGREDPRRL
jgi:hypothetical protein